MRLAAPAGARRDVAQPLPSSVRALPLAFLGVPLVPPPSGEPKGPATAVQHWTSFVPGQRPGVETWLPSTVHVAVLMHTPVAPADCTVHASGAGPVVPPSGTGVPPKRSSTLCPWATRTDVLHAPQAS